MNHQAQQTRRTRRMGIAAASIVGVAMILGGCASTNTQQGVTLTDAEMRFVSDPASRASLRSRAIETLTDAALGADPLLRANAIEGLHPAPDRLEPIARAGLADSNLGVRFVAAMTVGKLNLRDSAVFVEPLLNDRSPMVRAAAIYASRATGGEADPTPLAALLNGPNPAERAQAAYILGELGDTSAVGLLRSAARRSTPLASPIEDRLARLQIAEALVKLGDTGAIETVRAALFPSRPEDLEATALAVQIIGNVGDRRSIDQLIYLTAREGADRLPAEVRLAAALALARLGNPRGSFIAEEHWTDPNPVIRAQAAFVFGETVGAANLARLDTLLGDDSDLVRVSAAAAVLRSRELGPISAGVDASR